MNNEFKYIVIGGGIAGLSALERIKQSGEQSVILLESDSECGGLVKSSTEDSYLLETGPNAFLKSYQHTSNFIDSINLTDQVITNNPDAHHRFIFKHSSIHPIPEGPLAFLKTPLFSIRAKFRILLDPFIAAGKMEEESVDHFATRRFGKEVSSTVMDAMISGICAGNHQKLDIHSLFPKISLVEKRVRSFILFLLLFKFKNREKNSNVTFRSLKGGMGSIAKTVFKRNLVNIKVDSQVRSISREGDRYKIKTTDQIYFAKKVVLATPANVSSKLLEKCHSMLADHLGEITYSSITTCLLAYNKKQVGHKLNGFGFLIPRNQNIRLLGGLFSSSLFANRAPSEDVTIKTYIGGAHDPQINQLDDNQILKIITEELSPILSIDGAPKFYKISKIKHAIPQYNMGHNKIKNKIYDQLKKHPEIFLVGNYLEGISVNEAIKSSDCLGLSNLNF